MSRTRGAANRSLYRARLLLASWAREIESARQPEEPLLGAFVPAVRAHLIEAYGWFLLAVSGLEDADRSVLPRGVTYLPQPDAGRAVAPELNEFARLEADQGWLAELLDEQLAATVDEPGSSLGAPALLGSDRPRLSHERVETWLRELTAIMQRMDDSLSEC